jgi:hypothetical protein
VRLLALCSAAAAALALAAGQAHGQPRPVVAVSAAPARLSLVGSGVAAVTLRNFGASRVALDAAPGVLAVDLRGRPRVGRRSSRSAARWLAVTPRSLSLAPGGSAVVAVRTQVPAEAEPGDHAGLVVFSTRVVQPGRVGVRMRVGVRINVRVPGTIVRRLVARSVRARRGRLLDVAIENAGNVTEALARGGVRVVLLRRGRVLERLPCSRREVLPRTRALFTVASRRTVRGVVLARVEIRGVAVRTFGVRLP